VVFYRHVLEEDARQLKSVVGTVNGDRYGCLSGNTWKGPQQLRTGHVLTMMSDKAIALRIPFPGILSALESRVENRRSDGSLPVDV
jgi:hypothetical protein